MIILKFEKIITYHKSNLITAYMSERKVSEVNKSNYLDLDEFWAQAFLHGWISIMGKFHMDEFRIFFFNVYKNSSKILDEFHQTLLYTYIYIN